QVDRVSYSTIAQRRRLPGMRDDPEPEATGGQSRDGKADAVHGDRSLEHDQAAQRCRSCDLQNMIGPRAFPAGDLAEPIDVTGDEVAVEASVGAQRSLQVHPGAGAGELQVRATPRLAQQIEVKDLPRAARRQAHDREATTIHGEAVTDFQSTSRATRLDEQADGRTIVLHRLNPAGLFHDAREHGERVRAQDGSWQAGSRMAERVAAVTFP